MDQFRSRAAGAAKRRGGGALSGETTGAACAQQAPIRTRNTLRGFTLIKFFMYVPKTAGTASNHNKKKG